MALVFKLDMPHSHVTSILATKLLKQSIQTGPTKISQAYSDGWVVVMGGGGVIKQAGPNKKAPLTTPTASKSSNKGLVGESCFYRGRPIGVSRKGASQGVSHV